MKTSIPNYYAVIPAHVRYNNDLTYLARILYGEISALCNALSYCYASNGYFARLYGCTVRTVSAAISQLERAGLITMRTVEHRRLITVFVATTGGHGSNGAVPPAENPETRKELESGGGVSLAELFSRVYTKRSERGKSDGPQKMRR